MLIVDNINQLPDPLAYPVLTIGSFDGIHRGHQAIIAKVLSLAEEQQGTAVVMTFNPHPQRIITPATAPSLLQTAEQREAILSKMDVDILFRMPFSRELSLLSPERFVHELLLKWSPQEVVVGANFRFGHKRSGDLQSLRELCASNAIRVHAIEPVTLRGVRISSTRIRSLVSEGLIDPARRMLGRPYRIRGTIARGEGNGRALGYPTANLNPENELPPATGVYAGRAHLDCQEVNCVINVGYRPTLYRRREGSPVIEAHLLDYDGDLYGTDMSLDFCTRLRAEKRFSSRDELRKQIAKDIELTRKYVAKVETRTISRVEAVSERESE
jgi:riboflavin kinase / FMN adenylyltransferase